MKKLVGWYLAGLASGALIIAGFVTWQSDISKKEYGVGMSLSGNPLLMISRGEEPLLFQCDVNSGTSYYLVSPYVVTAAWFYCYLVGNDGTIITDRFMSNMVYQRF